LINCISPDRIVVLHTTGARGPSGHPGSIPGQGVFSITIKFKNTHI